ncbi:MAG: bifunctional diaminohydroxyphosphoribosylaminopyrimidine deaminase/5-amino-6-(5-phosphoribosylamino)uracil reductase RibD [Acidobacteriota bacterium]|nr:bifunctional diaminohydroxyphosphoribosylaminopyrimidine deaminase/5-amino-6-(5-phosphoribosylamino)uracil reductase RibD [Acidobacteriota bacterium]
MTQDEIYMQRALNLAAETTALASPNPQVGCVLVRHDEIIGEGAHLYDHLDHAEIDALKQAAAQGHSTAGATAYVTLEPCSHHGRTGPCADALIAAGIARCVVATADPNPQVAGRGIARLRAAGIDVETGVLQQPARDLNVCFAHFIQHRTPFVTLKAALSADGKLAPASHLRQSLEPHWLTGPEARHQVQLLRHASDAVLTGIGTVLADNPLLTDRSANSGTGKRPRRRPLLRVILDTHLRIPLESNLVRTAEKNGRAGQGSPQFQAHLQGQLRAAAELRAQVQANDLLILCGESAPSDRLLALRSRGIEVVAIPSEAGRLSLSAVLTLLGQRDILSLLLECGSHLNGAFLRQNLADKVILFSSETELGESAIPFAQGFTSPRTFGQSLHRITRTTHGPDTCVTGYLHDPWQHAPLHPNLPRLLAGS